GARRGGPSGGAGGGPAGPGPRGGRGGGRGRRPAPPAPPPPRPRRPPRATGPPPADTSARSITGTRIGWPVPFIARVMFEPPPTSYSVVVSYRPSRIRLALAVVPPMSNDSRFLRPDCRATRAAATTPAAGPDSTATAGMAIASAA